MSGYEFSGAMLELLTSRHNFYSGNFYPAMHRAMDIPVHVFRAAIEQAAYVKGHEGSLAHQSLEKGERDRVRTLEDFLGIKHQDAA